LSTPYRRDLWQPCDPIARASDYFLISEFFSSRMFSWANISRWSRRNIRLLAKVYRMKDGAEMLSTPMKTKRCCCAALAMLLLLGPAMAQIPPRLPPPQMPNPNPSSSYTLPPTTEVPVSPSTPAASPELRGAHGDAAYDPYTIMAPERVERHGVAQHHARHHRVAAARANAHR
jgi:hypothetical protein